MVSWSLNFQREERKPFRKQSSGTGNGKERFIT